MQLQNVNQLKPEAAQFITQVCVRAALRHYRDRMVQNTNQVPESTGKSKVEGNPDRAQCFPSEHHRVHREFT